MKAALNELLGRVKPAWIAAPLAGLALMGGTLLMLDRYAAYHSPLRGAAADDSPRRQALLDLQEWSRQKAQAQARRAELLQNLDTEKMVQLGQEIVHGRGMCFNCHSIGDQGGGLQGPNLEEIGSRAAQRAEGMSGIDYLAQSLYQPEAYVVVGYVPSMIAANQPPIGLDDLEIKMVVAYLQSLGGTPNIQPDTQLRFGPDG